MPKEPHIVQQYEWKTHLCRLAQIPAVCREAERNHEEVFQVIHGAEEDWVVVTRKQEGKDE